MPTWYINLGEAHLEVRSFDHHRPRRVTKVLVDNGTYAVNDRGEFFCSFVRKSLSFPKGAITDGRVYSIVKAAAKLGVLPKDAASKVAADADERMKRVRAERAADELRRAANRLGINLPVTVRRRLEKVESACSA